MVSLPHGSLSRRRVLAGLGLGAAALGGSPFLAACDGGLPGIDGVQPGEPARDKPALSVWYHQYGEPGTQQAVKRYAEDYPDAAIIVQWTAGDYPAKINNALRSDTGPDIFEGSPNLAQVRAGQLVPLEDLLEPVQADYTDADLESITVDGRPYGVRIVNDTSLLYYRRSLLEKAGVNPPGTLDELVSAANELTTADRKGLFIGNDAGVTPTYGGGSMLGPVLWSTGQNFLTQDNKINFTGDNVAAALDRLRQLVEDESILLEASDDYWDPSAFTTGLCAMQWTGLWAMPEIQKALGDDFGIVPFPAFSTTIGRPSTPLGGWSAMINAESSQIEAAKAYVKWLWIDHTAHQEDFNLSYGFHLPPRRSLAAKAAKLRTGPAAEAVRYYNQYAIAAGTTWTPGMNNAFGEAATAVVRKGQDPDTALGAAVRTVQQQLDQLLG